MRQRVAAEHDDFKTRAWVQDLVRGVDEDNVTPGLRCGRTRTAQVLQAAPCPVWPQARMALEDLRRAADQPLAAWRSDTIAHHFTVADQRAALNVVVARMTVPGGPWPWHFGLETVIFRAARAEMPEIFPPARGELSLHFGELIAASRGYRDGSGAVLFPEQLSIATRPSIQAFGVAFLDRLHTLFCSRVLPVLDVNTFTGTERESLFHLRRQAFLAHERGHLQGAGAEQGGRIRHRRLAAVISELHADLDAFRTLMDCPDESASATAKVLVADRIVREAWLRRPHAQVDAIVARHLLALLCTVGAVTLSESGRLRLKIEAARDRLDEELERVRELERICCTIGPQPAQDYLRACGWAIVGSAYYQELTNPVADILASAASVERHVSTGSGLHGVQ